MLSEDKNTRNNMRHIKQLLTFALLFCDHLSVECVYTFARYPILQ